MEFGSDQTEIVLVTLNAKYAHASFGLRYLMANLGPLRERARIVEFDINQRPLDVVEALLAHGPRIVGVGVYIWNAEQSLRLVADLKRIRPDVTVILGGPEVSHETDAQEIVALADYVITGEGDITFAELCEKLLAGGRPLMKVIPAQLPEFAAKQGAASQKTLALPYDFYDDEDVAQRVIYVEASRGCPFRCEFCLSSLDVPVRNVPLETFLPAMDRLLARGVRQFKFVDRTFNLNLSFSRAILEFFWERYQPGLFLHFEMIPDRLPDALREPIRRFPPGALQFEVGVQTFNEEVSQRISRRQDNDKLADNLRFLRQQTGVHVHADLIVGLPGEDLASFGRGFDRLVELGPQEIQVGILKRLRGTPIVRHDGEWGMAYSPHPPYEVLKTAHMDFATLQRMRRFARYWDLIANSGNFRQATPMIWGATEPSGAQRSPFESFMKLSDWLFARIGRNHGIALQSLAELMFHYLTEEIGHDAATVAESLWSDYQRGGRSDRPEFLKAYVPEPDRAARRQALTQVAARRQARHLA
ncbi:MAG: Radical domain protein [Phycisphaerales bacterium]|nr:Radical domain protein [Phycisphaerales bacterium]